MQVCGGRGKYGGGSKLEPRTSRTLVTREYIVLFM